MDILAVIPTLLGGALVTLQTTLLSAVLALAAAMLAAFARLSPSAWLRAIATAYVEVFRGTSALVQIFYFFFVLPVIGLQLTPLAAGVLALSLNFGAYGSEVVRAAIIDVPRGQRDAAVALNMAPALAMRRIIFPQALVAMMPSFGNLLIDLLKATSLLSLVTISDLTFAGKTLVQSRGHITETYSLVLVIYYIMALGLGRVLRVLERRVSSSLKLEGAR